MDGRLQAATEGFSFRIGLLLFLLMPTDLITTLTVGRYLEKTGNPYWHMLGFLSATLLLAGLPFILDLVLGKRAQRLMPKLREWMTTNSWIISEAVIAFFFFMMATADTLPIDFTQSS